MLPIFMHFVEEVGCVDGTHIALTQPFHHEQLTSQKLTTFYSPKRDEIIARPHLVFDLRQSKRREYHILR